MDKRIVLEWSSVDVEDEIINTRNEEVSKEKMEKICDIVEEELNNNDMLSDIIWRIIDDAIEEVCGE